MVDDFLRQIRRETPANPIQNWQKQPVLPLVRNTERDDFQMRESLESNPENYAIEMYPTLDLNNPTQNQTYKNISRGGLVSGIIDLRTNDAGKYTIWIGDNHTELMSKAAQIPDNPHIDQYLISIKISKETIGKITVERNQRFIGQSCQRTSEQISKILDAVDKVLENYFNQK